MRLKAGDVSLSQCMLEYSSKSAIASKNWSGDIDWSVVIYVTRCKHAVIIPF